MAKRHNKQTPQFKLTAAANKRLNQYLAEIRKGIENITANGIEVTGKTSASVMRIVTACKTVLEAMFNNSTSLLRNIRDNRRVYTSAASIAQIAELDDPRKKLKFLNEILDNMNYNPEFNSQNTIPSHSTNPYRERQKAWARRVGYKLKEI